MRRSLLMIAATCMVAFVVPAQQQQQPPRPLPPPPPLPISPSIVMQENTGPQPQQQPQPGQPQPGQPQPAAPATQPAAPQTLAHTTNEGGFVLDTDTTLTELITILARQMKLNYILDPRVSKGSVSIHTYGEIKPIGMMPLLMTVLRINGATMVQVGELYRIIPITDVSRMPIDPVQNVDPKTLPDDERMVMNMIFLKFATAAEIQKLLEPFMGEGARVTTYEPANLLIIQDNSRSMKRTLELIAMFDSETFAGQRVRLFDITNSRPSDLVNDLDSVFKAYSLADKTSVKFIPVDRINTLIAVAPNPGVFADVKKWIEKLDIPVKVTAGSVNNYVYRLKYGQAATVAMAIMALYSGNPMALMNMAAMANGNMYASGMGLNGTGYGAGMGNMGAGAYGMSGGGMYGGAGNYGTPYNPGPQQTMSGVNGVVPTSPAGTAPWQRRQLYRTNRPVFRAGQSLCRRPTFSRTARHSQSLRQYPAHSGHAAGVGADSQSAAAARCGAASGTDRCQDIRSGPGQRIRGGSFVLPAAGKLGDGRRQRQFRRAHPITRPDCGSGRRRPGAHHWSPGSAQPRVIGGTASFGNPGTHQSDFRAQHHRHRQRAGHHECGNPSAGADLAGSGGRCAIGRQLGIREHRQQSEHGRHAEPYGAREFQRRRHHGD